MRKRTLHKGRTGYWREYISSGNPKRFFGTGLLAFIDLLGFSRELERAWSNDSHSPLHKLLRIKRFASDVSRLPTTAFSSGTLEEAALPKEWYSARIHTISDSIVITIALPNSCSDVEFLHSFYALTQATQLVWDATIAEGFMIRGAVEWGHIYWDESETIGPLLVKAFRLESNIARWSRLVIGAELLKILLTIRVQSQEPFLIPLVRSKDGLIELLNFQLHMGPQPYLLAQVKEMLAKAPQFAEKYTPMLGILKGESNIEHASISDVIAAISRLEVLLPESNSE